MFPDFDTVTLLHIEDCCDRYFGFLCSNKDAEPKYIIVLIMEFLCPHHVPHIIWHNAKHTHTSCMFANQLLHEAAIDGFNTGFLHHMLPSPCQHEGNQTVPLQLFFLSLTGFLVF